MVQHEVLSGLKYVQVVKRKGVRVSKDQEMLVRYMARRSEDNFQGSIDCNIIC